MMLSLRRPRAPFSTAVRLPPEPSVAELGTRFAVRGWVAVDDVLPLASIAPIVRAMGMRRLECRAPHLHALAAGLPSFMFYEQRLRPHRACRRACAPICALAQALTDEPLLTFVRELANRQRLTSLSVDLRAYVKGSHVDRSGPTSVGIEVLCCVTPAWDAAFGGQLCFAEDAPICPCVGTLYVVRRPEVATAVTLVREHGPLVMLSAWFE
jgi:hypothetical protein